MPLQMSCEDPTGDPVADAYVWVAESNFNWAQQTGKIVYFVHRSEAHAYTGKDQIKTIAIDITPTGTPAVYGPSPVLVPEQPAVYGEPPMIQDAVEPTHDLEGNVLDPGSPAVYGPPELISPAVPAVLGEPPLLAAAVPAFGELLSQNKVAYQQLAVSMYELALSQPVLFPGATLIRGK